MKTVWYIAKKDLLQSFKDRNGLFFLLVMPMVLITVIGLALGGAFDASSAIKVTVAISNLDNGYVGQTITKALDMNGSSLQITLKSYKSASDVEATVADSKSNTDAGVVIPAGATDALNNAVANGQPTNNIVQFYALPNTNNQPTLIAQQIVNSIMSSLVSNAYASKAAISQVNSVCHTPGNTCAPASIDPQVISQAISKAQEDARNTSPVQDLTAGQAVKVSSFDLYVPGYAIFFALFSVNSVAGTILQEKEDGTFRRLLIAPIQKYALLGGKVLAQFILTSLQLIILFAFGYFVFHIHLNDPLAIALLLFGTSFGATGLGIVLVAIVKTRRQLNPIVTLVTLVSSAISGIWFPAWLLPDWLRSLGKITLPAWSVEGLNNIMIYGKGISYVLPDILVLFAYGLICYLIGLRLFRFQEKAA